MYTLPSAGPSFIGHIIIAVVAAVVTFGKSIFQKLAHKNG